nr:centromere-associated protein E-like [Equus asinus]
MDSVLDLEREIETQRELSIRVKANLSLPHPQTRQIQKLLTANQRCSMEFHRVMKKLKYVLSHVTKIKEEQHESISKLEMVFIDEVEKQNELLSKMQHLQQDDDVPSRELGDLQLSQKMDLHIEEILKDFSECDFHSVKMEFQQVLSNRKEMTQFLEEWLNTHFDIEKLKNGIQKENDRICEVNIFYNKKIIAIINESTEFEERNVTITKEWEHDLKSVKEKNEKLLKNYQTLKISRTSGALVNPTTQGDKNLHVTSRATQLTTEKIQELETSLREAKETAMQKEDKIIKMQKELEMTNDIIAKLQSQVNESNKCLEKNKEMIQVLQDKVALGAKPYKEEIEELKTKLVKIDLEKMRNAKEFEKEITCTKATVEHQKEVIRLLRENLRRNQQAQDTSNCRPVGRGAEIQTKGPTLHGTETGGVCIREPSRTSVPVSLNRIGGRGPAFTHSLSYANSSPIRPLIAHACIGARGSMGGERDNSRETQNKTYATRQRAPKRV